MSTSYTTSVYFLVPSHQPVPFSNNLGAKNLSKDWSLTTSDWEMIGTNIAHNIKKPKILVK